MRYLIFISLIFILLLPLVSSANPRFIIKQNTDFYNITSFCQNEDGTDCDSTTTCNITITSNDNILLDNKIMNRSGSGSFFYYNINSSVTYKLGEHLSKVVCLDDPLSGVDSFNILVTPTGDDRGVSFVLIMGLASVILLGGSMILKNYYLAFISGLLFVVLGVYTLINGYNNVTDLTTNTIAYTSLGLGVLFSIVAAYEWVLDANGTGEFYE